MKTKKHKIPIINIPFQVHVYSEVSEFRDKFKGFTFDNDPETYNAGVFEIDGVIHAAFHNNGELTPGMIAHECKHVVNIAFSMIGQSLDIDNDELECYFLTWVVDRASGVIEKQLKNN